MEKIKVTFLGTGDAFGHGGRLQPCVMIQTVSRRFLVDCGTTALIAMNRFGIDPNSIEMILLSHLHGDHFGGLPFFLLDAQLHSKRRSPLTIAGPEGTGARLTGAMEVFFPGSSKIQQKFPIHIIELTPQRSWTYKEITVHPFEVCHPSGDTALALRLEIGGKTIAFTGDTEWCEALVPAATKADLLIAEAYFYEKQIKYHLNYQTLKNHLNSLQPGKLLITHMSQDMLDHLDRIEEEAAEDGLQIEI